MQLTCPCCHAKFPLGAALDREAGAELMALLSGMAPELARPLVAYLGLFRARTTQLGWDRAGRLAGEVLALSPDTSALAAALADTVSAMDEKRHAAGWKPLSNHNYLRRVLESTTARQAAGMAVADAPAPRQLASRTGQALNALEGLKR